MAVSVNSTALDLQQSSRSVKPLGPAFASLPQSRLTHGFNGAEACASEMHLGDAHGALALGMLQWGRGVCLGNAA